MERSRPLVDE